MTEAGALESAMSIWGIPFDHVDRRWTRRQLMLMFLKAEERGERDEKRYAEMREKAERNGGRRGMSSTTQTYSGEALLAKLKDMRLEQEAMNGG